MSNVASVSKAAELLSAASRVLIITHKNPDGDTLGSGYAMWATLTSLGKRAKVVCDSIIPARYDFITKRYEDEKSEDFEPDFILAVDTASLRLMGDSLCELGKNTVLCIDHHETNEGYAQYLLCDSKSASCCEIVAKLIDKLGIELDEYISTCLYVGASTDTGCFKYSNTTGETHRLAARLIDNGVDVSEINFRLFEQKSKSRIKLEQMALAGMEITAGGKIAIMTITLEMLKSSGCEANDVEGITPIPRTIEGVEAGVTLRETREGVFKVSLRTKTIDASKICAAFGGGGHIRASGFECSGTQFDIKVAVVAEIEKAL